MPSPWGPILRFLRFPVAILRDWLTGEINVRAMSLAYTTLLSLVPLLVFIVSMLKVLGARGDLHYILHQFLRPLGSAADQLTLEIMQFVANMRGDVLGTLGLGFLVYTVVTTIQKVEASFNFVWRVAQPRSLARRSVEYLAVMILGPLMLAATVGFLGSAEHSPVAHWLAQIPAIAWAMAVLGHGVPYGIVTAVFTLTYLLVPNTHVNVRAALIGGVTAGALWALVGEAFTRVMHDSSQMVAVYTGFAIVLSTLVWIYLSWLILLLGGQLAFYVQLPQYLRHGQATLQLSGSQRETAGLAVLLLIGRGSDAGARGESGWTANDLAAALDIPATALAPVLASLRHAGLLRLTAKERVELARDPAALEVATIIEAARGGEPEMPLNLRAVPACAGIASAIETAIHSRLAGRTLRELLAEGAAERIDRH